MSPVHIRIAIEEIENSGYGPTPWEIRFMREMKNIAKKGRFTRGRQENILNEILRKSRNKNQMIPARTVWIRDQFI